MKTFLLIATAYLLLLLIPYATVLGESQPTYTIQIGSDGSATWTVTQTLEINASIETLETLQNRITRLVEASESTTGRTMAANVDSLTFTRPTNSSYIEAEYRFEWQNFCEVQDAQIVIGDVFRSPNFFDHLYGDGEVYITYPPQYVVQTVQPAPFTRNDSIQTLEWLGTKDVQNGTRIVLMQESTTPSFIDTLKANALLIAGLLAIAAGSSIGFYVFRHNKKKKVKIPENVEFRSHPEMESDEQKTVNLIRSSGGKLYQSAITNQLGFSKAKTSQLLGILEHKGAIRRYKKGRDKIVVLLEQEKNET
ncbi:MAG: hypothetical protein ABSD73_11005 [Candidatus Bathyarchaeia archaeon]|jgi:uncharacterized membrane protein